MIGHVHGSQKGRPHSRRLAILVPDYVPAMGGTTTQTRLQAKELAARGWDITILTRRVRGSGSRDVIDGLSVQRVGVRYRGTLAKAVTMICLWWWLLRRRRLLTAINVIMDPDFALCACVAGRTETTVLTWASLDDPRATLSGWKGRMRARVLKGASHVALTPGMKHELDTISIRDAFVIAVPVDTVNFRPPSETERIQARHSLALSDEQVVIFIGHIREDKGVRQLLEAIHLLREQRLNVALLVVGDPLERADQRYLQELRDFVSTHSLSHVVQFVGQRSDVRPFLNAGDVLCLPSVREGMPNVLLEAMASGLPCIAPHSAGGGELLKNGAGCIPASNDPLDLSRAIVALLESDETRAALRQTAIDRVARNHSVASVIDQYEEIFDRIQKDHR